MPRASLRITALAISVAVLFAGSIQPATAASPLREVDVGAFASRAQHWADARQTYRNDVREQALQLGEAARQSEADRLAAEEADRAARDEREREAELAAAAPSTTQPAPTTTAPPAASVVTQAPTTPGSGPTGAPTAAQWEALRQCEASGNYAAVSANGRYRGAYQFSQDTWDWIAGATDQSLIGADPAGASPAQQDAVARGLWDRRGWASWPGCRAAVDAA